MKQKDEWKPIGVVGVDSGTLMIGDPCYFDDEGWTKEDYDKHVCHMKGDHKQLNYERGHAGKGVLFTSGLGDGCYKVFAKMKDCGDWGKRIAEVKIVLIEEKQ